jgi:hypothetical protein
MSIRIAVVVSDLHCGSKVALCPPEYEREDGSIYKASPLQQWLWGCWEEAWVWAYDLIGDDEFALIVNGDVTEGNHHGTKEIWAVDDVDHMECAVEVLKPHAARAAKTLVSLGTECHTAGMEHAVARRLGAVPPPGANQKGGAWNRIDVDIAGTRCCFRHHITTTSRPYLEASALSIHLGVERLEAVNNGEDPPRVLGCAHRHRYGQFSDGEGLCFVTPPWQMLTRYGHKVVGGARTKPGLVLLDWRDVDDGDLPEIHARTFRPPTLERIAI